MEPGYRQIFLNDIDLEQVEPYVKKLHYINRTEAPFFDFGAKIVMETIPSQSTKFGVKNQKSKIYVYPPAFDTTFHPVLDDFLTTLIDHEGHHAKEYYMTPQKIITPIWKDILDVLETSFFLIYNGTVKDKLWTCEIRIKQSELRALENVKKQIDLNKRTTSPIYQERIQRKIKSTPIKI